MKKFVLLSLLIVIATFANAQPRAIGGRIGYGVEASYQHSFNKNFLEIDAGLPGFSQIGATATYNFMICEPFSGLGTWGLYAGPGVSSSTFLESLRKNVYWGTFLAGGQIGLEYMFESIPLQISLDYRPMVGVFVSSFPDFSGVTSSFYHDGLYNFGLSFRYCF